MRRQHLSFDSELRTPLVQTMPSADIEGTSPSENQEGKQFREGNHSDQSASSAHPERAKSNRTSTSSRNTQVEMKSQSRFRLLCGMLCSLLSYVVAVFWGLCTNWILVLVLAYFLFGTTFLLGLVLVAILGLVYNIQDSLLYFPNEPESSRFYVASPNSTGMPNENLYIQTADGMRINAVLFKQADPLFGRVPTVLALHGNAGNIAHRYVNAHGLYALCGCNVLFLEYRGYGRSEGHPSETGFYIDAQAGLDYLHDRSDIDARRIVIFGRSLGGAVAIHLASQPRNRGRIAGLIVENSFTSIPDIGSVLFHTDLLRWIPLILVKNKYFSINKVKDIRMPALFISGIEDELVPARMMQELFQRCGTKNKQLIRFQGGTHNETWRCQGYFAVLREFLTQATYGEMKLIKDLPPGAQHVQATSETSLRHHIETV